MDTPVVYATRRPPPALTEGLLPAGWALDLDPGRLPEAEGVLCFPGDAVGEALFARAPRLRAVATASVGFDHVDVAAARARGIVTTHTPGVLTEATAELAFALLLAAARRVVEGDRLVRAGRFAGFDFELLLGVELAGATLGVVGPGRIGCAVLARAAAFGMERVYFARGGAPSPVAEALGARRARSLDELLEGSDAVSLHVPLTAATRHLLGARELARMRPGSILVNTARGAVIDEGALVDALRRGRPGAAGLDVYEAEPRLAEGLAALPNAVLLPHLGSATARTRRRMLATALADLERALAGRAPRFPIGGAAPLPARETPP